LYYTSKALFDMVKIGMVPRDLAAEGERPVESL
jgi:hypothetical protein